VALATAVAGYSAGAGFQWSFIKGSMLLYSANLAGIVLSGTLVFLLIIDPTSRQRRREWHVRCGAFSNRQLGRSDAVAAPSTCDGSLSAAPDGPRARFDRPGHFRLRSLGELVRETRVQRLPSTARQLRSDGTFLYTQYSGVVGEKSRFFA